MSNSIPQVIAEIVGGEGITFPNAAKLLPAHRGEGYATTSSLWRWATVGATTPDGRTVKLEAARFGGRWLTSRAALARFASMLTPGNEVAPQAAEPTRS